MIRGVIWISPQTYYKFNRGAGYLQGSSVRCNNYQQGEIRNEESYDSHLENLIDSLMKTGPSEEDLKLSNAVQPVLVSVYSASKRRISMIPSPHCDVSMLSRLLLNGKIDVAP